MAAAVAAVRAHLSEFITLAVVKCVGARGVAARLRFPFLRRRRTAVTTQLGYESVIFLSYRVSFRVSFRVSLRVSKTSSPHWPFAGAVLRGASTSPPVAETTSAPLDDRSK